MTAEIKDMTSGLTVGAGLAKGLLDFAVLRGAAREVLLERAGIAAAELDDLDHRIALDRYKALMRAASGLTGNPAFALHYGEHIDFAQLSIVGLIVQAADTFGDAFREMNRYNSLVIEVAGVEPGARFAIVRDRGATWVVDQRADPDSFPELTESGFARGACGSRGFAKRADKPFVKSVHVTHAAPAYRAEYDRVFQVPVVFESDRNALEIDEDWLAYPVARTTRYAFGVLSEHAKNLLDKLDASKTTRGRIESMLIPILHEGEPSLDRIASGLGISRQTLYRRLKDEGTTFEKLLDELRHAMALHYLDGKKVSVNQTAYLVGFSDPSAFSRAFKRWTGTSPRKR